MIIRLIKKLINLNEWIIYDLLSEKQRKFLNSLLTEKQKSVLKRIFTLGKKRSSIIKIEETKYRLYNLGFRKKALTDLHAHYQQSEDPFVKRLAAWELALWYANQYSQEGARRCLDLLNDIVQREKDSERLRQAAVLKAECQELLGNIEEAKHVISLALESGPHADLYLAAANLESSTSAKMEWINKALRLYGISEISLTTNGNSSLYDNLTCGTEKICFSSKDGPKVSVIMPVYNTEKEIHTSLKSILSQTWPNIELLVVDDCSTDATVSIVEEFMKKDLRVRLIKAESNGGAYVARNLGLKEATGDFVTVNDADDWSHPEKIETQVRHLLKNPSVIGNTSQQARATNNLKFYRRGKPGFYIFSNMSSFMFRRKPVMESIGFWDSVRFGADSEFIKRIKKVFGEKAVIDLATGPLSFQRQSEASLTGNQAFGFPGYFMGARKEYLEGQLYYHAKTDNLYYNFPQLTRPFHVPEPMWPKREKKPNSRRHFDVIIASDFRLDDGSHISHVEKIKAYKENELRTGLIQLYRYDYPPRKKISTSVRDLIDSKNVQMIVYGEQVSCNTLIICDPPALQEWQAFIPDVKAKHVYVIVDQMPLRDYGPTAQIRYNIKQIDQHIQDFFGQPGVWYPSNPIVRQALYTYHAEDLNHIFLSDEDWADTIL